MAGSKKQGMTTYSPASRSMARDTGARAAKGAHKQQDQCDERETLQLALPKAEAGNSDTKAAASNSDSNSSDSTNDTTPDVALTKDGDMPFMYLGSNTPTRDAPAARVITTNPTAVS